MSIRNLFTGLSLVALAACAHAASDRPAALPGSDRDAHGCIASAGYLWCSHTQRCERPWELARQQGFAPTADGFADFCDQPPIAADGKLPPE